MLRRLTGPLALVAALGLSALAVAIAFDAHEAAELDAEPARTQPLRLTVRGGRIVDGRGNAVLLRGFNVIPVWDDQPGRTWAAHHYRRIRDRGFNTVRFVLHWSVLEPRRGRLESRHMATLDRAIQRARAAGLYVVLDAIHIYKGETFVPVWARTGDVVGSVRSNAHGYLSAIARRYRRNATVAAIDLVSEPPTYPLDQNRLLAMYSGLIATVRAVDGRKLLMFNASNGDSSMAGADLGLLADRRNLVFTMYDYYAGGADDGYRADGHVDSVTNGGAGTFTYDGRTGYPGNSDELRRHFEVNLGVMRAAGIPVWIGAFGINPDAPNGRRWIREKVDLFQRNGVGYAWWLYGTQGGFATLDERQRLKPFTELLR